MKRIYSCIFFLLFASVSALYTPPDACAGPARKFSRGFMNTSTGWVEIFTTAHEHYMERRNIAGLIYGIPLGFLKGFLRTGAGLYEMLTFPFPMPSDYSPVLYPEYITGGWETPELENMKEY